MEAHWIQASEIRLDRLDADFHRGEYVINDRSLRNAGTKAQTLRQLSRRVFKGAFYILQSEYTNDGVPFIRTLEIKPGFVDLDNCTFLSISVHQRESKTAVGSGDILIAKTGASIGYSAVIPSSIRGANISQDIVGIRLGQDLDPYYLDAFLKSPSGQAQAMRWRQGNAHPHLGLDGIRQWIIPRFGQCERVIGNMIRKAERLRQLAQAGRQVVDTWIARNAAITELPADAWSLLEHAPASTIRDWGWVEDLLTADRLDPWPHHVAPRTIRRHLTQHGKYKALRVIAKRVTSHRRRREFSDPGAAGYYISVLDLDFNGHIDWDNALRSRYAGNGISLEPNDILYSCINPQQPRVSAVRRGVTGIVVGSPEFAVLRSTTSASGHPHLLSTVLRSGWVRVQASFATRSSSLSRRRIEESDLDNLLVPWSDDCLDDMERHAQASIENHEIAAALIEGACNLIESLIAGTLDEPALLAEGEAIEQWLAANPSPHVSGAL